MITSTLSRQVVVIAAIWWSILPEISAAREDCSASTTDIPMSCCPTEMLNFCCQPIVRACNETIQLEMTDATAKWARPISVNNTETPSRSRRFLSAPPFPTGGGINNTVPPISPGTNTTIPTGAPGGGAIHPNYFSSLAGEDDQQVKPYCMHPMNSSACLGGFFLNTSDNTARPCPSGFYCLSDLLCIIPCPEGAYCASDYVVPAKNDSSRNCKKAGYCCEPSGGEPVYDPVSQEYICAGSRKPYSCRSGYFCPNVTYREICPPGYFCREGSTEPEVCPILGACDEGVSAPVITYAGIALLVVIVLVIAIIIIGFHYRRTIRFYTQLYASRYLSRDGEAMNAFQLDSGLRMAVIGASDIDNKADKIVPKKYKIDIAFKDLCLKLKGGTKKSVLAGVTGRINSGEVTAVMGPSGAGKTTFLNTLSGKAYYGIRGGEILINGRADDLDMYRTITGFVPQEDVMHRILTVKEILMFQAELRLSSRVKKAKKEERIRRIIELLELEHVQDSQIGDEATRGISGGQRKRVNIGMELVSDPTLLFLDEPTSGLDSTSSLSVLNALRAVAEKGRLTVVCVIHQPRFEIFRMFHNVLFLGTGGRTVFQGSVEEAERYFQGLGFEKPLNINPADFYMDVISGVIMKDNFAPSQLFDEWKTYQGARDSVFINEERIGEPAKPGRPTSTSSEVGPAPEILTRDGIRLLSYKRGGDKSDSKVDLVQTSSLPRDFEQRKTPNVFSQLLTFYRREMRLLFRIARSLLIDQCMVLLAGGLLGLINTEVSLGGMFQTQTLSCLAIALVAMLPALRCFGNYRTTFWRESASGVNRFSYFLAVDLAQVPVMLVSPLIYLSLLYALTIPRGFFIFHYASTVGAWYTCVGAGYLLSIIFNPRNAQMATVLFALVNSLMSGSSPTLCSLDDLPFLGPLMYTVSFARWYLESLFEKEAIRFPRVLFPYVYHLASRNAYSLRDYPLCLSVMFVQGIVYRILAFIFLCLLNRGKQK